MISWLVTGAGGQLATELVGVLSREAADVTATRRTDMDLTDEAAVRSAVRTWLSEVERAGRTAVLVNAAAFTAVDAAETDEPTATVVNGRAPGWMAEELAGRGRLVHVSTDYVFDGSATRPYVPEDEPSPRTAYGRSKLAGERAVAAAGGDALVVRTAWVYASHGQNFVTTMLRLAGAGEGPVRVVDDQRGSPTWARDLAVGLVRAAGTSTGGVLHAAGRGEATWWDLARLVFELAGADPTRVLPVGTDDVPRPAARPPYSVLDPTAWSAAGLPPLPPWQESVRACLREIIPVRGS